MRTLILLFAAAALVFAQRGPVFKPEKLVDLTHVFDENTIYWPTSPPFSWKKEAWGKSPGGNWYASASFCTGEHVGTHIDSPIHFAEGKMTTADIPVSRLAGAAAVIDITSSCAANPDYTMTAADIAAWEKRNGPLRAGDIVLVRTGWGRKWPDKKGYLGTDKPGDEAGLRFPGIAAQAAHILVQRQVAGVGIDTPGLDSGQSQEPITHRLLNGSNIYGMENVANLHLLPETGATVIALPVKVKNGTGGPVRIIAVLP